MSDGVFSLVGVANGVFGFVSMLDDVLLGHVSCVGWSLGLCILKSGWCVSWCAELKGTTRWIGISCGKKENMHA